MEISFWLSEMPAEIRVNSLAADVLILAPIKLRLNKTGRVTLGIQFRLR